MMERMEVSPGDARSGYEPLLRQMQPLYSKFMASGQVRWSAAHDRVAHLAHGWFTRCERSIDAIVVLDATQLAEQAAPIRRSIIEHVLALKWIAADGNAVLGTVARGHAFKATKRRDAVADAGWTSVDLDDMQETIDAIEADERDAHGDSLLHYSQRWRRHGDAHELPGYLRPRRPHARELAAGEARRRRPRRHR